MGTKKLSKEEVNKLNINRLHLHKSGSISGMKKLYYTKMLSLSVVETGYTMYRASPKYTKWSIKLQSIDNAKSIHERSSFKL